MTEHPFKVGVEVAIVSRSRWNKSVSIIPVKVGKINKNGNFVLEGSQQQYRPGKGFDGEWQAFKTGGSRYDGVRIELITPDLLAEVAQYARNMRAIKIIDEISDYFSKSRTFDFTDEMLSELDRVATILRSAP